MQLLVNVFQHQNNNLAKYQQGDVIASRPNDHPWGWRELRNPAWRVIQDDSMTELVASILNESLETESGFIKRISGFNLYSNLIDYDMRRYLMDNSRRRPIYRCEFPTRLLIAPKIPFIDRVAA